MYTLFLFITVVLFMASKRILGKWLNPCSIYLAIWVSSVSLYNLKWIYYADLSNLTYWHIIGFEVFLSLGIFFGDRIKIKNQTINYGDKNIRYFEEKRIDRIILISTFLSGVAIISNLIIVVARYGLVGLLSNISSIYQDREAGVIEYVDYLSPFVFIAIMLVAMQIKSGRFKPMYVIPIALTLINAITFGGRNNIVQSAIFMATPFLIGYKKNGTHKKRKKAFKTKVLVLIACAGSAYVFYIINMQRALATVIPNYVSPFMHRLININYSFYKTYQYFTEPIGYLNKYLESPYYIFGGNTFHFIIKQLNKIGMEIETISSLPFLNVPVSANVGTYITELVMDFGAIGGLFFTFLIGTFTGLSRKYLIKNPYNIGACTILCILYVCIGLSFFMWYGRSTNIWVILIMGLAMHFLNRHSMTRKKY